MYKNIIIAVLIFALVVLGGWHYGTTVEMKKIIANQEDIIVGLHNSRDDLFEAWKQANREAAAAKYRSLGIAGY
jgi:hypothetical protein